MLKERHFNGIFSWPDHNRIAVTLTFDFQGGEDVRPLANGKINHEEYTQAEYGPNTAVWRILRILEDEGVKATFLTCGGIAERYPEAVKAIVAKGHEVAGHGYHHEVARDLAREEERTSLGKPPGSSRTTRAVHLWDGAPARKAPIAWSFLWSMGTFGTAILFPMIFLFYGKRVTENSLSFHDNPLGTVGLTEPGILEIRRIHW